MVLGCFESIILDMCQLGLATSMIKILFLAANPKDTDPLRLGEEVRAIKERLRLADLRDQIEVEQEHAVRVADLQGFLLRHKPHIVHFSGHGSRAGEIILEDVKGQSKPVSPAALKRTFATLKDNIRCVVLNACYSEVQAKGIAESIDCVVGMTRAIGDESAIAFAASFYQGLGYGRNIQEAFDLGCGQIDLEGLGDEDVPRLETGRKVATDGKSLSGIKSTATDMEPNNSRWNSLHIGTRQPAEEATSKFDSVKEHLHLNDLMELVQISRELAAQVNLEPLLQSILSKASELTNSPASSVILYNSRRLYKGRRGSLYFAAATGDKSDMLLEKWGEFAEHQIPVEGSIAGKVFVTKQTLVVDKVEQDSDHFLGVDRDTHKPTESMICVPLTFADEKLGVMQILNKRTGNYTTRVA
jgi:CHAT domain/GAF domain